MISSRLIEFSVSILFVGISQHVSANADFPPFSQQCRDDAGPPFADDEELFGKGGKYHDGSFARPILQNEQCAPPVKKACDSRPSKKTAYLEGPIDCGGNGWYCRITKEDGWKSVNLVGDYNFGLCNSEEAFDDDGGTDKDGHCHGSEDDSTYYWWVRDHWHRQYNGHLRCCCGWFKGSSSTAMYDRRIANRCDYRRLVKEGTAKKCRDANEDHGKGFDDIGCDKKKFGNQLGKPIPEDDNICWEVSRFGYTQKKNGTKMPSVVGGSPAPSSKGGDSGDDCDENKKTKFYHKKKKNGKVVKKSCNWLSKRTKKQKKKICASDDSNNQYDPANIACPVTCDTCDKSLSPI